jgi:hypothetical protein
MARVWCRKEMIFLREELIAEGLQPLLFFQLEFGRQEKHAIEPDFGGVRRQVLTLHSGGKNRRGRARASPQDSSVFVEISPDSISAIEIIPE